MHSAELTPASGAPTFFATAFGRCPDPSSLQSSSPQSLLTKWAISCCQERPFAPRHHARECGRAARHPPPQFREIAGEQHPYHVDGAAGRCRRALSHSSHFFNAASQLRTTVIGGAVAPSTDTFIRKRPSEATAYCGFDISPEISRAAGEPCREERHRRARLQRLRVRPNRDRHRHQAGVRRDIEQFLPVGPPPRLASARRRHLPTGRRAPETVGRKSPPVPIRSTDTPPTARRGRIALRSRRRAVCSTGNGLRSPRQRQRPEVQPRSSDAGSGRAGAARRATRPAAILGSAVTSRGCSSPAPLAAFSNRSIEAVAQWT